MTDEQRWKLSQAITQKWKDGVYKNRKRRNKMKYKAGDMVKVIKVDELWGYEAREMLNGVFEIKSVGYDNYEVYTKDKNDFWYFKEEHLELVQRQPRNLIQLIAKELGVEIGERFNVESKDGIYNAEFSFTNNDLIFHQGNMLSPKKVLHSILTEDGIYTIQKLPPKPTLTETERTILQELYKKYTKITRIENTDLWVFNHEKDWKELCALSHLFQFIKPDREPYNIAELLGE